MPPPRPTHGRPALPGRAYTARRRTARIAIVPGACLARCGRMPAVFPEQQPVENSVMPRAGPERACVEQLAWKIDRDHYHRGNRSVAAIEQRKQIRVV